MTSTPPAASIVFRGCRSPSERQAVEGLLACGTTPAASPAAGVEMFALWDLTNGADEGLVGAVAIRPLADGATVALCGVAVASGVRRQGLGRRLVCEVAEVLRRRGAARLVDGLPVGDGGAAAAGLLRRCGFSPADAAVGGLELEL